MPSQGEAMSKKQLWRDYRLERDEKGDVKAMHWYGDYEIPHKKTREEIDRERLVEHEKTHGKREL
jgi:hypothetical protein